MKAVQHGKIACCGMVSMVLMALVLPVSAELLLYDGMDYAPAVFDGTQAGGTNTPPAYFTGAWLATTNYAFVADSLAYATVEGLPTQGNKAEGTALHARRFQNLYVPDGTIYCSFLFNPGSNLSVPYACFIPNHPNAANGMPDRVMIGVNLGTYKMGTWYDPGTLVDSGVAAGANRTDFVVVRMDMSSTGNDTISVYINPGLPSTEPAVPDMTTASYNIDPAVTHFCATETTIQFDEIRYGTTWDDVTPSDVLTGEPFTEIGVDDVIGLRYQTQTSLPRGSC